MSPTTKAKAWALIVVSQQKLTQQTWVEQSPCARGHRPPEALFRKPNHPMAGSPFRAFRTDTGSDKHCAWSNPAAQKQKGLPSCDDRPFLDLEPEKPDQLAQSYGKLELETNN